MVQMFIEKCYKVSNPLLSIVTISFNQSTYLRQCLKSVIDQKNPDVEYIVVDAGSTDGSRDILRNYGHCINHLIFEPDAGPADGLNKGFAMARGKLGYFINSDDFMLPGAVSMICQLWKTYPDLDVLLGEAWKVDSAGRPICQLPASVATVDKLLLDRTPLVQQGMVFQIDLFRSVGGFNPLNRTCWDYELLLKLLASGASVQATKCRLGAFRHHSGSLTGGAQGEAATRRYEADLERIHYEMTGSLRRKSKGYIRRRLDRGMLLFRRPRRTLLRLRDAAFPRFTSRQWRRDMLREGGE